MRCTLAPAIDERCDGPRAAARRAKARWLNERALAAGVGKPVTLGTS